MPFADQYRSQIAVIVSGRSRCSLQLGSSAWVNQITFLYIQLQLCDTAMILLWNYAGHAFLQNRAGHTLLVR